MKPGSILAKAFWVIRHQSTKELFERTVSYLKKYKLGGLWYYQNRARSYKLWLKNEAKSKELILESSPQDLKALSCQPLISIIMPVWNSKKSFLEKAIISLLDQAYPLWELCIADDASSEPQVAETLNKYKGKDPRVKVIKLNIHGGNAKASNAALSLATGDFVGFFEHDDLLAPHALLEVVKLINKKPDVDIIYSDEDRCTENDTRFEPSFKPDWSPDYLLSTNYIRHFLVVRKNLLNKVGNMQEGLEGCHDYDLILRLSEQTTQIAHLPEVLYHWRMTSGSESISAEYRQQAYAAGLKAVKTALNRRGIAGEVLHTGEGYYRIKYKVLGEPLISIIIPTRDKMHLLKRCLNSIEEKSKYRNYEIIIVNDNSIETETIAYLQEISKLPGYRVLSCNDNKEQFNYARINNFAAGQAKGDYLLFLNNDTEIINGDWLEEILSCCQRPDIGVVGVKLLFPDNRIQHAGVVVGLRGVAGHVFYGMPCEDQGYMNMAVLTRNYSAVTAACSMIRRDVFKEVEGFDEELDVAYNDVDLCLRISYKGYFILWTPHVVLYHHESASKGQVIYEQNKRYFLEKWKQFISQGDPYYNSNLNLMRSDFSLIE